MSAALDQIRARIAAAARAAGRDPADVTLTAVCKQQPWENIESVLAASQRIFGENRVREASKRWAGRREGVELRLIGPLQSNKAKTAIALFDVIETLDRQSLCRALAQAVQAAGAAPRLLVQVNIGEEPQKAGVAPAETDRFIAACRSEFDLHPEGLMCIPPQDAPPAPYFDALAGIAARNSLAVLSMGMSEDFEIAIAHGATHVRIGSALFGARAPLARNEPAA